jgi:hypothetical protein
VRNGHYTRVVSTVRARGRRAWVSVVLLALFVVASPVTTSAGATSTHGAGGSLARHDRSTPPAKHPVAIVASRPVLGTITIVRSRTHGGATSTRDAPPARKYQGLSLCTDSTGLRISQGRTEIVSGIAYTTIIFVNAGTSNCYLNGTPFTQPVGARYSPVGPPAAKYFDPSRGGYVILDAGGGTASTSLGIANAAKYYPRSSCAPKKMIGVTLRFSFPADFFFRIGAGPIAVCKKITTTSITGVARGVIYGP